MTDLRASVILDRAADQIAKTGLAKNRWALAVDEPLPVELVS